MILSTVSRFSDQVGHHSSDRPCPSSDGPISVLRLTISVVGQAISKEYADNIFINYLKILLASKHSLHLVFDVYQQISLKTSTRQARGSGIRLWVQDDATIPRNWSTFLRCDANKAELFEYLAETTSKMFRNEKEVFITIGDIVKCSVDGYDLSEVSPCTHEEVDTRMIFHSLHTARSGYEVASIRTVDTDVVVLALVHFKASGLQKLFTDFGTGLQRRSIPIHELVRVLDSDKVAALSFFMP